MARVPSHQRRWVWVAGAALVLLIVYPFVGGAIIGRIAASTLSSKLGVPVTVGRSIAGLGKVSLSSVRIGGSDAAPPLATVGEIDASFAAAWGGGTVTLEKPQIQVERGGPRDNVSAVLQKLSGPKKAGGGGGGQARRYPRVVVKDGALRINDAPGRTLLVGAFDADVEPGKRLFVDARQVSGAIALRGGDEDPTFGAASVVVEGRLAGLRPAAYPRVTVKEGYVRPLATLPLTGINGAVDAVPVRAGVERLDLNFSGSYAGAKRSLWKAQGSVTPPPIAKPGDTAQLAGELSLVAERFTLDKIADVLPDSVLEPESTTIDAALNLKFAGERIGFGGSFGVAGLSLQHEKLASEPVIGMTFGVRASGIVEPAKRRLELTSLEGRIRDLVGQLSGTVELTPGTFKFKNGRSMPVVPKIALTMKVPRLPCAKLLSSIPGPIVPRLQGFVLQGMFEAEIRTNIDYADLEALELGGKIAIDGCKVLKAPPEVLALAGPESIVQMVEVPPKPPGAPGVTETMLFPVGPDNPDFTPFDRISPHIINSIMTTEDNGFFKHRGWVTPEFKTALRRNLENGGFRLGASSITMQTVKNVLLSHEKTLSRKLQELFIVWYVEQLLPKERILELYFNAIEFGPRIYGIGAATRHYFGKAPADVTPMEAAFFSSILPSPKRRYIQYCHGQLYPPWDKYVRRILLRIYERGRLTEQEYAAASAQPLMFNVAERGMDEKQCLAWVKRITYRPEPEPEPEPEAP